MVKHRRSFLSLLTVLVVSLAAGVMFGVSAANARHRGTAAELSLADLVQERQAVVASLETAVQELSEEQKLLLEQMNPGQTEQSSIFALRGEVSGPGVTVTLDDAPADFVLDDTVNVNAAVVHQQDVDGVMNALWRGGAEALSVQGVRITSGTPVRCVGNVILVGSRSYAPPYEIAAIGDVDGMIQALDEDPIVQLYRDDVSRYQLGWGVQTSDRLVIAAAPDLSALKFATIEGGTE